MSKIKKYRPHSFGTVFLSIVTIALVVTPMICWIQPVSAQQTTRTLNSSLPTSPELDPTKSSFRIVVCDGPAGANTTKDPKYVPCDFNGIMLQIQHLINIMMVLGVFASIGAFSWAGALYISGNPKKKEEAHKIFPKVFTGFIIMLSAWFIVYQILSWLTDNAAFKTLLGNP
ncbi:MAG: hypothetical protein KBC33_02185 [Candidatus Pacebacteria bacterium]|nr:hypothetical protein [Candidatus Paceibacterota bacterium]